jgi:hypothetical protein
VFKEPVTFVFSQVLHHVAAPRSFLTGVLQKAPEGSVLFLREDDCRTPEDVVALDFLHWLYEFCEGSNVPWSRYVPNNFYGDFRFWEAALPPNWEVVVGAPTATPAPIIITAFCRGPDFQRASSPELVAEERASPVVGRSEASEPEASSMEAKEALSCAEADDVEDIDLRTAVKTNVLFFSPAIVLRDEFEALGMVAQTKRSLCGHPHAAAYRANIVQSCLGRAIPSGIREFTVLDYFGGARNQRTYENLPANLGKLNIVSAPDFSVAGDAAREFRRTTCPRGFHTFLVQDVYHDFGSYSTMLSPATLLELCNASHTGTGYIITRRFLGELGHDSDLYDEGLWYRDQNHRDLVHFFPDPTGVGYAQHPDNSWLFQNRTLDGLAISEIGASGPYTLFMVSPERQFVSSMPQIDPQGQMCGRVAVAMLSRTRELSLVDRVIDNLAKVHSFLDFRSPESRVLYDTRIHAVKVALFQKKLLTPQLQETIATSVANAMSSVVLYRHLLERAPRIHTAVANGTVRMILYGAREEAVIVGETDARQFGDLEARLLGVRKGIATVDNSRLISAAMVVAVAGVLAFFLLKRRTGSAFKTDLLFSLSGAIRRLPYSAAETFQRVFGFDQAAHNLMLQPDASGGSVTEVCKPLVLSSVVQGFPSFLGVEQLVSLWLRSAVLPATVEELARTFFPKSAFVATAIVEPLCKLASGSPAGALFSFAAHSLFSLATPGEDALWTDRLYSFMLRWAVHLGWNTMVVYIALRAFARGFEASGGVLDFWAALVALWRYSPAVRQTLVIPVPLLSKWLSTSASYVPTLIRADGLATLNVEINGEAYTDPDLAGHVMEQISQPGVYQEAGTIYPIITPVHEDEEVTPLPQCDTDATVLTAHQYYFVRPSTSPINTYTCILQRTLADPGVTPNASLWQQLHKTCRGLFFVGVRPSRRFTFLQAIENMDPIKRKRLLNAMQYADDYGRTEQWKCGISVKHNEVLLRKPEPLRVKPRAIIQIDPEFLADCTAEMHSISHALHEIWSEAHVYDVPHSLGFDVPTIFLFASGYTQEFLNARFADMLASDISWYWVAGDDNITYLRVPQLELVLIFEGDFSRYDSTQGKEALMGDLDDVQELGFDREVVAIDCQGRNCQYRVIVTRANYSYKIKFSTGPQQSSGLGSTTWGNSSRNVKSGVHAIQNIGLSTPEESAAGLGFALKWKLHDDPFDLTFLKGWWVRTESGNPWWLPLPSMVLKLAKMLRSPTDIFPRRGCDGGLSQGAVRTLCIAGADSRTVPYLGAFCQPHAAFGGIHGSRHTPQTLQDSCPIVPTAIRRRFYSWPDCAEIRHLGNRDSRIPLYVSENPHDTSACQGEPRLQQVVCRLCIGPFPPAGAWGGLKIMTTKEVVKDKQTVRPGLKPGDKVLDSQGNVVFHVDREKAKNSLAKARKGQRERQAQRPLPAPNRSNKTKKAVLTATQELERRRRRAGPVVREDWGYPRREDRISRRINTLHKRVGRRRRSRAKRNRVVKSSTPTLDTSWTGDLEKPGEGALAPATGEGFWGGLLDSAVQLAPHIIPLVAGMGDYEESNLADQVLPQTNSLAAGFSDGEMCNEVPAIHNIGSETRFTHREYIGDVYSSSTPFAHLEFPVNPGMNETFPWASRSIANYEQYSLLGAMFVFESEASEYSATPGLGYVALGSQYDVSEPLFTSKKTMFQSQFSVARKPSETFAHWIECNPSILVLPKKFVRTGSLPAGSDLHLYDHCRTTLAVGGQTSSGAILGELWITYDCIATLPRSDDSAASSTIYGQWTGVAGTVTQALIFGTSGGMVPEDFNTFTATFTGNVLTLPPGLPAGDYIITITWRGGSAAVTLVVPFITVITNGTSFSAAPVGTGGSAVGCPTSFSCAYGVALSGAGASVITWSTVQLVSPSAATATVVISQIPLAPVGPSPIFDKMGLKADELYEAARGVEKPALLKTVATPMPLDFDNPSRVSRSFFLHFVDGSYCVGSVQDPSVTRRVSEVAARGLLEASADLFDSRLERVFFGDREL